MKRSHWILAALGIVLLLAGVWQVVAAARGLSINKSRPNQLPLTVMSPAGVPRDSRPLVLIGHGFAGSRVIMRGFAFTLAHAGYTVLLWDFDGHGQNPHSLSQTSSDSLLPNAEAALAEARNRGWGDPDRAAIVGHSMGSGVAMSFGQVHPETSATVAISPVSRSVTPELPRNLLLMAGSLEQAFVKNAQERLAEAGGAGGDAIAGTARSLQVIDGVEHMTILFSPTAHHAVRDWMDLTFGQQPGARSYTDRRVAWYGVAILGFLMAMLSLSPLIVSIPRTRQAIRPLWWRLCALLGASVAAALILWALSKAGLGLRQILRFQVGGYVLVWFGLAGCLALLSLWRWPSRPKAAELVPALLSSAALWLGVGLLGQLVWLPWMLIPRRLAYWPLGLVLILPWFLAIGEAQRTARPRGRVAWWLVHSVLLCGALYLAMQLSSELRFLLLILPLFPVMLALHAWSTARLRSAWPFALSGALFTSWLILAVFPV